MCTPNKVVCELERLRQSMGGWDWGAFASTLLATVLGAAIGIGGVLFVASRERRERSEAGLDAACTCLMQAVADYRDAAHAHAAYVLSGRLKTVPQPIPVPPPSRIQVEAAQRIVAMLARGDDAPTFGSIDLVVGVVLEKDGLDLDEGVLCVLNLLSDWRSGGFPREVIASEAEKGLKQFGHP